MDCRCSPDKSSWFSWLCSLLQSPLLLVIRLIWGILFIQAGIGKLGNMPDVIQFFEKLEIPYPEFSAYLVAIVEAAAGFLITIGLFTRLAAIPLAIIMLVAFATDSRDAVVNLVSDFENFMEQAPFPFLLASFTLIAFGPGIFSVDALFHHRKKNKSVEK